MSWLFSERSDEEIDDLMWKLIRKKQHAIYKDFIASEYKRFKCEPDLKPMPVELFQNETITARRNNFFKTLHQGDILYLQVINSLPDSYKLWVLAKHKGFVKVDDLLLVMHLPKWWFEMRLLDQELKMCEFIRAAFCSGSLHERKLYVTLDELIQEDKTKAVKFGRIKCEELPHYVGTLKSGLSYVGYIHHSEAFCNPKWARQMCKAFDLDRKHVYSFFDKWEGKKFPTFMRGPELKEKQNHLHSNKYYQLAIEYYERKNVTKALACLNSALDIWSNNIQALTTRGTVHANTKSLRKAFMDTEGALQLDPTYKPARKQMSALLVAAARTHIDRGNFVKAKESLRMSSSLDENNNDAIETLQDLMPSQRNRKPPFWEYPRPSISNSQSFNMPLNGHFPSYSPSILPDKLARNRRREMKKHHRKRSRHHHSHHHHHHHHKRSKDQRSRSKSPRRYSWRKLY